MTTEAELQAALASRTRVMADPVVRDLARKCFEDVTASIHRNTSLVALAIDPKDRVMAMSAIAQTAMVAGLQSSYMIARAAYGDTQDLTMEAFIDEAAAQLREAMKPSAEQIDRMVAAERAKAGV